jgi:hypothetical protein
VGVGLFVATAWAATPFGGDDTGFVPPDSPKGPIAKCEAKVSKAVVKLVQCIGKCHDSRASGKLADDTAEDACESGLGKTCKAKFATAVAKLTGCPPCLTGASLTTLANNIETLVDGTNSQVYCQSPSGAFLDTDR